jgi:hypothetical protein
MDIGKNKLHMPNLLNKRKEIISLKNIGMNIKQWKIIIQNEKVTKHGIKNGNNNKKTKLQTNINA